MKILSIQTGKARDIIYKEKTWSTGIFKNIIQGPVFLDKLGLQGDVQANLNVHGGEGRALYAFGRETYKLWQGKISDELLSQNGIFGENLTLERIDEESICVGDQFQLGETLIEATMPRFPCFIFAERVGYADAQEFMHETKKPGVLFRVLKTGIVSEGDELKLLKKSPFDLNMTRFLRMGHVKHITRADMDYLKSIPVIPAITIDRLEF